MDKIISFNNRTFQNIFKSGKSYGNKLLVIYYVSNGLDYNRLGITVSKKNGNSVVRHRVKRLIKESYRLNDKKFVKGYDIIFIARVGIENSSYCEVQSALKHLMKKNNLLEK
ncbi:ribonuclease P protein component [Alkalibaculum sp. M08DMB]|uniref:Ribonuclease P protein component n=1 Tax=Alkalibaculum sporogenes TaxID=2655001 RepID=A0A6A7K7F4_9FIRM|nr:ribonuclease P protein component [Alkalibaculum sporogenes]MPW25315.1 ribonuclease P protein component [Alkalibaculum sporogenes]